MHSKSASYGLALACFFANAAMAETFCARDKGTVAIVEAVRGSVAAEIPNAGRSTVSSVL